MRHPVNVSPLPDDPALLAWHDLCPPCLASFRAWQCAPNPGAWTNPAIQDSPQLLAWLASMRVTGPSPEAWHRTISEQLLLIRRICTDRHNIADLGYGYPDGFRYEPHKQIFMPYPCCPHCHHPRHPQFTGHPSPCYHCELENGPVVFLIST